MLLFRSRPQIPCRDITLCPYKFQLLVPDVATSIPCRDISSCLCSFQLVSSYVATLISCRDISSCLCNFQLVVPDVATSISCRDINLMNYNLQMNTSYVATLISCRDINLCVWRLQLVAFGVAKQVPCRDIILDQRKTCHSFKALLLLRPPSLVTTSTFVATSRCFRDITMLSRHHSLSIWLILSCLTCDPCRDLHQISFNFPNVATS